MISFKEFITERNVSAADLGQRTASIHGRKIGDRTRIPLSSFDVDKVGEVLHKLNRVSTKLWKEPDYDRHVTKKTLPISSLNATQGGVDMEDHGTIMRKSKEDRHIHTVTHKGEHYIMDGHHHVMAKKLRGDKHIEVDNLNLDNYE